MPPSVLVRPVGHAVGVQGATGLVVAASTALFGRSRLPFGVRQDRVRQRLESLPRILHLRLGRRELGGARLPRADEGRRA